jgi:hypothetical protein
MGLERARFFRVEPFGAEPFFPSGLYLLILRGLRPVVETGPKLKPSDMSGKRKA